MLGHMRSLIALLGITLETGFTTLKYYQLFLSILTLIIGIMLWATKYEKADQKVEKAKKAEDNRKREPLDSATYR